jgi:ABC-type phosphate/phosphonate transport system permease subunit
MNTGSIHNPTTFASQSLNSEALAAIHDSAKQRAQALRREAISSVIDSMIAWAFRRVESSRRAPNARSELVCQS